MKLVLIALLAATAGCTSQDSGTATLKTEIIRLSKENSSMKKTMMKQSARILNQKETIASLREEVDNVMNAPCETNSEEIQPSVESTQPPDRLSDYKNIKNTVSI
jgi:uncharacterized protein YlxW (UPF0749 family)